MPFRSSCLAYQYGSEDTRRLVWTDARCARWRTSGNQPDYCGQNNSHNLRIITSRFSAIKKAPFLVPYLGYKIQLIVMPAVAFFIKQPANR